MANNPYVNKVQLADGTTLMDISDTTAKASDVAYGKYFYNAAGMRTLGSNSGGSGEGGCDCTQHLLTYGSRSLTKLECLVKPKQEFTEYGGPWAGGAGKNLLDTSGMSTAGQSGVTFSRASDGVITVGGKANTTVYRTIGSIKTVSGVQYTITGVPDGAGANKYRITVLGYGYEYGSGYTFTGDGNSHEISMDIYTGYPSSGTLTFKPMIRLASEADANFAPYENICPITGLDAFNIYHSQNTEEDDAVTYPVSLSNAGTVYGGYVDAIGGNVKITDALIASYNGESLPSTWMSDRDVYSSGASPTIGAQVVYKLSSPQTVQISPISMTMNDGVNNIWADVPISDLKQSAQNISDFTNDSGYLTLATLPIYNGGVS